MLHDYSRTLLSKQERDNFFEQSGRHYNPSQRMAIEECQWRKGINLVLHPPGTGKTRTIVGMVLFAQYVFNLQRLPRPPGCQVLLCSLGCCLN